ncbi:hypothetical protein F3Y22_tig00110332pilonHSYRG00062 [Hibiscus syriacus]|uniref:Uncharacterized protein n=1 Tax=Hibiscus syriacus TaxID=106335 RepID=A0A6A3B0I1_HIBSY|nr:hypothetical protein F3Y22_tig00110332pilonHSYRG00062 [Hibiscus syriacus]
MGLEDSAEPNPSQDHILDWLEDSASFLPSFLDVPYGSGDDDGCPWWDSNQEFGQHLIGVLFGPIQPLLILCDVEFVEKKETTGDDIVPRMSDHQQHKKNHNGRIDENEEGKRELKRLWAIIKGQLETRKNKSSGNNGNNKEGRWAEQLLNPCATAITAGNLTRVQHLLYVLTNSPRRPETQPPACGSWSTSSDPPLIVVCCLDCACYFRFNRAKLKSLIRPELFTFLTSVYLMVFNGQRFLRPCLAVLEGHLLWFASQLWRPQLKITRSQTPLFDRSTRHDFYFRLPNFAKSMNINLQINRLENHSLEHLNAQTINSSPGETFIVCAQFRLHHLDHNGHDQRTGFLKVLRSLEPKGVILSENNMDCSCSNCGDFATGFSRRVEYLWKFLDSTARH